MKQIRDRTYGVPNTLVAVAVAAMLSTVARAQQAPSSFADESNKPELETVVVTGSMIKRVNAETAEAITVLKSDSLKDQGIQNLEQALATVTAANPSINIARSASTDDGALTATPATSWAMLSMRALRRAWRLASV